MKKEMGIFNEIKRLRILGLFIVLLSLPLIFFPSFFFLGRHINLLSFTLTIVGIFLMILGVGIFQMLSWARKITRFISIVFIIVNIVYGLYFAWVFMILNALSGGYQIEFIIWFLILGIWVISNIVIYAISRSYLKKETVIQKFSESEKRSSMTKVIKIILAISMVYIIFIVYFLFFSVSNPGLNYCYNDDYKSLEDCMLYEIHDLTYDNVDFWIEDAKINCDKVSQDLLSEEILESILMIDPENEGNNAFQQYLKDAGFTKRDYCYFFFSTYLEAYSEFDNEGIENEVTLSLCGNLIGGLPLKKDVCILYSSMGFSQTAGMCEEIEDEEMKDTCYIWNPDNELKFR